MRTIVMVSLVATLTIAGCGSGYKPPPAPPAQKPQASQTSAKPAAASTAQTPAPQSGAMGAAVMSGGLLAPSDMMNGPEGVAPARSASPPAARRRPIKRPRSAWGRREAITAEGPS